MPTTKREWYPDASYHVTARGNHRNYIFKDKEDFVHYLTLIVIRQFIFTQFIQNKANSNILEEI